MKYVLLRSVFIIPFNCMLLMYYLQVKFPFWRGNERPLRESPCRLSETLPGLRETRNGLSETSNGLSENSPLLSERVINKRTRTVKTRDSLKYFLAGLILWFADRGFPLFPQQPHSNRVIVFPVVITALSESCFHCHPQFFAHFNHSFIS
jgi:hypothetical protein